MDPDTEQLRHELRRTIDRYAAESDITICEVLGILELIKAELIDRLKKMNLPDRE